jgi:hypothetical protein
LSRPDPRPVLCTAAALAAAGLWGCAKKVDPDPLPVSLTLGRWHAEQLDCRRGDCVDTYRIRVPESGELQAVVLNPEQQEAARPFALSLQDGSGAALARAANAGAGNASLQRDLDSGEYVLELSTADEERAPLRYEIQATFTPPPPPPPPPPKPQFETVTAQVLEVEGRPGSPDSVLIDRGRDGGLRPGLRGRLVDGGRTIASVQIQDAYPEGSRARIEGSLAAPITPATIAEIDIPIGDDAAGDEP